MSWRKELLFLLLFLIAGSNAFASEWYKDYGKAQDAVKSGDCHRAQTLLLQALQQNPTTGLRVPTYGTMRMEYIPHLYLAECAYKSGNISQAASYINQAEASGAASSSKAAEFSRLKTEIQNQLQQGKLSTKNSPPAATSIPPPSSPAPQVPTQQQQQPPPKPVQVPAKPAGPTPEQKAAERRQLVSRTLREANDAVADRRYAAARDATNRVLLIDPSNEDAQRLMSQIALKEAEETKRNDKESKFADVRRALRSGDWMTAESLINNLQTQYPSDSAVASLVQQVQREKEALLQKKTDEELRKALEKQVLIAYYQGDYEKSIQLAQQAIEKSSDNWRLHFFLGCSYASLAMLQDDNKQPRLDLAKESFRKARSLAHNLTVPPYISPKILEIYRSS